MHDECPCDFEVNQTKIKGGCQSGREVVPHDSKSYLLLRLREKKPYDVIFLIFIFFGLWSWMN